MADQRLTPTHTNTERLTAGKDRQILKFLLIVLISSGLMVSREGEAP